MGYIGNNSAVQNFTPTVDYFNGNGSTTSFTLSRSVGSVFDIQAFIENVPQNPSSAFTVAGNVITFTSAPPSGTNNIYVRYTSPVTQLVKPAPGTVGPTEINSAYSLWNLSGSNINYTAGSVGIGTSPSFPLDISAASGTTARIKSTGNYSYLRLDNTSATGGGAVMCFQNGVQKAVFGVTGAILGDTSSDAGVYAEAGQGVRFYSNGTERMRINSAGQIAWGTSSIDGYLTLTWAGQTYVGFVMNNTDAFGTSTNIRFKNNGTTVGEISSSTTATNYVTSSDYRLKENIAPMTGALAVVQQLKPVTYTWKSTGEASQGFIAHELQEIVPDCVTGEKDAVETYTDEDGNEQTRIKPQGIDTSFLVATLTAAIQEQQAIIENLKTRIEILEDK